MRTYDENADRNRIRNQGSNQAVLVDHFDIPVVGTKFVSLCGGMDEHASLRANRCSDPMDTA